MRDKSGQFSFTWIFAIIVGAAILFLAIYGATKTGETQRFRTDTEIAKSISTLVDPLHAGFAEGSFGKIIFGQETRINNVCLGPDFGRNEISVSTRSGVGEEWQSAGGATSIYNKYIFSSSLSSGEDYYLFSKPFKFPYKVSDMIFLTTDNYCFVDAPNSVVEELSGLNMPNIEAENCTLIDAKRVCFSTGSNCDIKVIGGIESGTVEKDGVTMKYVGNLMYAAIFSDRGIYECNVERLMYRAGKIAEVFIEKTDLMSARGCDSNLKGDLILWEDRISDATSSDLASLLSDANVLDKKNGRELCEVWK